MGNSEVGHMTIGSGRVIEQDLARINRVVKTSGWSSHTVLKRLLSQQTTGRLHLMGLVSPGGVHSHEDHILALAQACAQARVETRLHAFLDGRDTPPRSAKESLDRLVRICDSQEHLEIGTICGRYYAMDRDSRWDRTERAYRMLTARRFEEQATSAFAAIDQAYARGETDEFIRPTRLEGFEPVQAGDSILFANFRADRARQLTESFVLSEFDSFRREPQIQLRSFAQMTAYLDQSDLDRINIPCEVLFEPSFPKNTVGSWLSEHGKTQLRIAETEKYAHVTYFFSGGIEKAIRGETRRLIPSPKVATYDLQPMMSSDRVAESICDAVTSGDFDCIIANFANGDMVGHTGNFNAAIEACAAVDWCLERILQACQDTQSHCLITSDHGNVERMFSKTTNQPHTAHTTEHVPLVYVGPHRYAFNRNGTLADVAPTMLDLMSLPIPDEMTGISLIRDRVT